MTEESDEEMAFNAEVDRLINEGMSCPTCNANPTDIESVSPGYGAMAICTNGHHYYIVPDNKEY